GRPGWRVRRASSSRSPGRSGVSSATIATSGWRSAMTARPSCAVVQQRRTRSGASRAERAIRPDGSTGSMTSTASRTRGTTASAPRIATPPLWPPRNERTRDLGAILHEFLTWLRSGPVHTERPEAEPMLHLLLVPFLWMGPARAEPIEAWSYSDFAGGA